MVWGLSCRIKGVWMRVYGLQMMGEFKVQGVWERKEGVVLDV